VATWYSRELSSSGLVSKEDGGRNRGVIGWKCNDEEGELMQLSVDSRISRWAQAGFSIVSFSAPSPISP
jgi:hypothetical protein